MQCAPRSSRSPSQRATSRQAHYRPFLAGQGKLEEGFKRRFGADLPETLNENHRLLIVASHIDASSERIIKYLSDTYGVNINAATFQYFKEPNGSELLARVFLIEPAQVELQSRTKGASKRRPNLTYEELDAIAAEKGVQELYRVPLGKAVSDVLRYLIDLKKLHAGRCLLDFPHPSGANGHRARQFTERRVSFLKAVDQWFACTSS
jgi:hypothetical protein